jgi:hypothetical protein
MVQPIRSAACGSFTSQVAGYHTPNGTVVDECSGLALSSQHPGVLWTHNDDTNDNRVFAMTTEGTVVATYTMGTGSIDPEDIAIGPGPAPDVDYIYWADNGDNGSSRGQYFIRRAPEPTELTGGAMSGVEYIRYVYPPTYTQHRDSETVMVDVNGDIYIVTKRLQNNHVFVLPYPQSTTAVTTLQHVLTLPSFYWITGGDISRNGAWIALRNDQGTDEARIWYRNVDQTIGEAMSISPLSLTISAEPQGESLAWEPDGIGFYTLTESHGGALPIWYYERVVCVDVEIEIDCLWNAVSRNVEFVTTQCGFEPDELTLSVDFDDLGVGFTTIEVNPHACWMWVREGHTLGKLLPLEFNDDWTATVSFTGENKLLSGDFSNPPWVPQDDLVDITDFSILSTQWNQPIDPNLDYWADATGDGLQDVADFSAIQTNFAKISDPVSLCD